MDKQDEIKGSIIGYDKMKPNEKEQAIANYEITLEKAAARERAAIRQLRRELK